MDGAPIIPRTSSRRSRWLQAPDLGDLAVGSVAEDASRDDRRAIGVAVLEQADEEVAGRRRRLWVVADPAGLPSLPDAADDLVLGGSDGPQRRLEHAVIGQERRQRLEIAAIEGLDDGSHSRDTLVRIHGEFLPARGVRRSLLGRPGAGSS